MRSSAPLVRYSAPLADSNQEGEEMFDLSLTYSSELAGFGSVDLVARFAKYLNALSVAPVG